MSSQFTCPTWRLFVQVESHPLEISKHWAFTSTDLAELLQADFWPLSFGILCQQRCIQASACQTPPIRSGAGQLGDPRCFGILAVQRQYEEYLCLGILKRLLRYMQSDRCPISSCVCDRLTPFHGGNTGSNPVGDAKIIKGLLAATSPFRISDHDRVTIEV